MNLYRTRDGAETEAARVAAGYSRKTKGGYPRSKFVRHRSVEEEPNQQCAEKGMHKLPTEFEGGHLEFKAMGGQTPDTLADALDKYKADDEDWDIVLIMCMLNGLAKTNKNF